MHKPVWLFDLDNTLHNASPHIFPHINQAMTDYIAHHLKLPHDQANQLRLHYWQRYGATLHGLIRHHQIDAAHFLAITHEGAAAKRHLIFDRALKHHLKRLPGRKLIITNGPREYAHAILKQMRIAHLFARIYCIEDMGYVAKPHPLAFRRILARERISPQRCTLVEDSLENLRTAKHLGMRTLWISRALSRPAFVDRKLRSVLAI